MNDLAEQSPLELAKECAELNVLDQVLLKCEMFHVEPMHRFTPGLYSRTVYLPKGYLGTSKIHKTAYQFVVSKGLLEVWENPEQGWVTVVAPHLGESLPGARRAVRVHEDTIWTTFHATNTTDLAALEKELFETQSYTEEGS